MINGRETSMVRGESRALTLLSMSGAAIDSVEVMTNPSAQFGAEGSGGIINIITRRDTPLGTSGGARLLFGNDQFAQGSFNVSSNTGPATYSFSVSGVQLSNDLDTATVRSNTSLLTGASSQINTVGTSQSDITSLSASLEAEFRLNDNDTVGVELGYSGRQTGGRIADLFQVRAPGSSVFSTLSNNAFLSTDKSETALTLTWDRSGSEVGENVAAGLSYSRTTETNARRFGARALSAPEQLASNLFSSLDLEQTVWVGKLDTTNVSGLWEIKAGVEVRLDSLTQANLVLTADSLGALSIRDTRLSNAFSFDQTISAAYVSLDRPVGEAFLVNIGLRFEQTDNEIAQLTDTLFVRDSYSHTNPSLFLTYFLSRTQRIRFSYGRRLQRPLPRDLNPFVIYRDDQNLSSGNPLLQPQVSDGFELGYEIDRGRSNLAVRMFHRSNHNILGTARTVTPDNVIVTRTGNLGDMDQLGMEFSYSLRLDNPQLILNLSGGVSEVTIRSFDSRGPFTVSGTLLEYRAVLTWPFTTRQSVSLQIGQQGARITREETLDPQLQSFLSYTYRINNRTSLFVSLTNPLEGQTWRATIRNDVVTSTMERSDPGPSLRIGLNIAFSSGAR